MSFLEKHFLSWEKLDQKTSLVLMILYASLIYYLFTLNAIVPDEYMHWVYIASSSFRKLKQEHNIFSAYFYMPNHEGLGGLFWYAAGLIRCLFNPSFAVIRLITFAAFTSITYQLYLCAKHYNASRFNTIMAWLSQSAAFWMGKVSCVDTFCMALSTYACRKILCFKSQRALYIGFFCTGIACGLKLSFLPILVFLGSYLFFEKCLNKDNLAYIGLSFLVGFVIAQPNLLLDPFIIFAQRSYALNATATFSFDKLKTIFFLSDYSWDLVINSGFHYFLWNLWLFMGLAGVCLYFSNQRNISKSLFVSFLISVVMVMLPANFLGWYWLSFAILIPLFTLCVDKKTSHIIFIIIIANLCWNFKTIKQEIGLKIQHAKNLQTQTSIIQYLNIMDVHTEAVVNYIEVGAYSYDNKGMVENSELLHWVKDEKNVFYFPGIYGLREGKFPKELETYKNIIICIGDRVAKVHFPQLMSVEGWKNLLGKDYNVILIGRVEFVSFYKVQKCY